MEAPTEASGPRVVLLITSPRLPAGLLTAEAWDLVRAHPVYTAETEGPIEALISAGVDVTVTPPAAVGLLDAAGKHGTAVWFCSPGGDAQLVKDLGMQLVGNPGLAELELMYGSWDPQGSRLLDAVTVIDQLVSPGGDPWKQAQTHRSLARYLLEEAYETVDAIEAGDPFALREELGDVLLQVVLHARLAQDGKTHPFSVDDVASGLVEKMIRRNPHVFAGAEVGGLDEITANWERIKEQEKPGRSPLDGMSRSQPALSLAAELMVRAERAGLADPFAAVEDAAVDDTVGEDALAENAAGENAAGENAAGPGPELADQLTAQLIELVGRAARSGIDIEARLRAETLAAIERAGKSG